MGMRESLSELRKWLWTIPTVILLAMFGSWVAGQCRDWQTPESPPVIEGKVDPGKPSGPAAEAPTAPVTLPPVAVPVLSREEVLKLARKYGLELVTPGQRERRADDQGTPRGGQPETGDRPSEGLPEGGLEPPYPLAEETFGPGPAGDTVDASAWYLGPGLKLDLRAEWHDYQPPATPICPPVGAGDGWFGNEARWVKSVGAGYGVGRNGAGLAGRGSIDYLGPRTGAVTWGAGLSGVYVNSPEGGDYAAVATFNLTW